MIRSLAVRGPALTIAAALLCAGCASSTAIHSIPEGAAIHIDGVRRGSTPSVHTDEKTWGSVTRVVIRKEGFHDLDTTFKRNEKLSVLHMLGMLQVVPWFWLYRYDTARTYVLRPMTPEDRDSAARFAHRDSVAAFKARVARLVELDWEDSALSARIEGMSAGAHIGTGFLLSILGTGVAYEFGFQGGDSTASQASPAVGIGLGAIQMAAMAEIFYGVYKVRASHKRKSVRRRRDLLASDPEAPP